LLKHLHKVFNKCDIPWVHLVWNSYYNNTNIPVNNRKGSFWWKDVLKLLDKFKDMASATIGDGSTCLFWSDAWHGPPLRVQWPQLFSFATMENVSVQLFMNTEDKTSFFHLPLSVEAHEQFQVLISGIIAGIIFTLIIIETSGIIAGDPLHSHLAKLTQTCWVLS
jgi:hypothetical protein